MHGNIRNTDVEGWLRLELCKSSDVPAVAIAPAVLPQQSKLNQLFMSCFMPQIREELGGVQRQESL